MNLWKMISYDLHLNSELTETASSVLKEILSARGINKDRVKEFVSSKETKQSELAQPGIVSATLPKRLLFMFTLTRIGITIFALAVVFGPLYTVDEYSAVSNLISELGAQQTQNNFIMIIAFVILGGGIVIDGVRRFRIAQLPFILFGLAMAIVGIFPHKPIDTSLIYNATYHSLHGIIASIASTVITVGFIWQGFRTDGRQRIICYYMALVAIVFPILMLSIPSYQGIVQRVMYLQVLGWLWMRYPIILANHAVEGTASTGAI